MPSGPLTDQQRRWNVIDAILNRWEAVRADYSDVMESWDLPTFLARTFPDWDTIAVLRQQGAAAACLRRDDLVIALSFTWPKGCSPVQTQTFPASTDPDAAPITVRIIRCDIDNTPDNWRTAAFDTGLTESLTGSDPLAMITELLLPNQSQAPAGEEPSLRDLLAIEALLLAIPEEERPAARMLAALRGLDRQHTGYDRLA